MWSLVFTLLCTVVSLTGAAPSSNQPADFTTTQWDFIIVGAGPAGIIVADRLSESGKKTLLLEGGGPSYGITGGTQRPSWLQGTTLSRVDVPGLYKSIFGNPGGLICSNTHVNAYGGCTVGGSSAINAGLYFLPPASDFDTYFPSGWKSADMKASIAKLQSRQPGTSTPSQDGKRYLQSGYLAARKWLVNGAGYSEVEINAQPDRKTKVFGHPVYDYQNGQRGGPVTTYLQTALKRANFQLQTGVRVIRVARQGSKATGVVANINGVVKTIALTSSGRVVLSAGAIQSPQILMYSGIGDPTVLTSLGQSGILGGLKSSAWVNTTAIGDGLFDNPNTFIELEDAQVSSYTYSYDNPPTTDKLLYLNHRSGPYSFASQTSVFWTTISHADGSVAGVQGTIDSSGFAGFNGPNDITLNVYGTSGLRSTGKVILGPGPAFIPGPSPGLYYSDPGGRDADDIATFIHDIFAHLPGSGLQPKNILPNASKDDIKRYITTYSTYADQAVNHWSSSCRFAKCVDVNTKVIGTDNLHVVDASIVAPLTVNPQMGIMIVAEKAAERILSL